MNGSSGNRRVPRLSKSRYTSFLDCPRLGYLRAFPARFGDLCTITPSRQALFDTGTKLGESARDYYPGGRLIKADYRHIPEALRETREALAAGCEVLYEAAVQERGILIRADILRRLDDGTFELVEVKSSASLDEKKHVPDVAVQLYVLEAAGLPISRAYLLHLDRDYVHPGGDTYDPRALFTGDDVTDAARRYAAEVLPPMLESIHAWLSSDDPPGASFRASCRDCEFYDGYCRPRFSRYPPGELGAATLAIACLEEAGVCDLADVEPNSLDEARLSGVLQASSAGPRVWRMIEAIRRGETTVDPGLGEALDRLAFPLHFLDFETWYPALPVFVGTRPYEQIPFQWSDHRMHADGSVDHATFLAEGSGDPRPDVAASLVRRFADAGSVLAYHSAFEAGRLRDLACLVPALEAPLLDIADRLVDLKPFVKDHVYHPDFHGSFSLKAVLPALVPGCGYEGLAISDGSSASRAYERLRQMSAGPETDRLRADMLAYCAQDTWGMVEIYRLLRGLA